MLVEVGFAPGSFIVISFGSQCEVGEFQGSVAVCFPASVRDVLLFVPFVLNCSAVFVLVAVAGGKFVLRGARTILASVAFCAEHGFILVHGPTPCALDVRLVVVVFVAFLCLLAHWLLLFLRL